MTKARSIRVLVFEVGQEAEVREVPSKAFDAEVRKLVGGSFEVHELDWEEKGGGIDAFVNSMGMADGLPRNRWVPQQYLHGTIVVTRTDAKGETVTLTDADVAAYSMMLKLENQERILAAAKASDGPKARVLVIPAGQLPRLAWVPTNGEGGAIEGLQALVAGIFTPHRLEGPEGERLVAFVNFIAEDRGEPKNRCVDGTWLHGTIVVGRPEGEAELADLTDADLAWCAEHFGLDLSHLALELGPRVVVEFPLSGPA